jgi:dihydrolipoamide dehydrogenase
MLDQLIPGCDPDLLKPLQKRISARYEAIHLGTTVEKVEASADGVTAHFGGNAERFDRVLVAIGRRPNGGRVGAEAAGVTVDERGFIHVDEQMRTNVAHIVAIGDVVGDPMLAHKATHEGKLAADVIAGENVRFDARSIPSVAYTTPRSPGPG